MLIIATILKLIIIFFLVINLEQLRTHPVFECVWVLLLSCIITFCMEGCFQSFFEIVGYNDSLMIRELFEFIILLCVVPAKINHLLINKLLKLNLFRPILYIIVSFSCLFLIAMTICLRRFQMDHMLFQNETLLNWCLIGIYGSIGFISVVLVSIRLINLKLESINSIEHQLNAEKLNYFLKKEKVDEETQKFRHDAKNHLICVKELINSNNFDEADKYLLKLLDNSAVTNKLIDVSNITLNAILNYYSTFLPATVDFKIMGSYSTQLDIPDVDLCTIFSNLIQNAVEELHNQNNYHLHITFENGELYSRITIENSYNKNADSKTRLGSFSNLHGIGLNNAAYVIKQNNGKLEIKKTDKSYFAVCTFRY